MKVYLTAGFCVLRMFSRVWLSSVWNYISAISKNTTTFLKLQQRRKKDSWVWSERVLWWTVLFCSVLFVICDHIQSIQKIIDDSRLEDHVISFTDWSMNWLTRVKTSWQHDEQLRTFLLFSGCYLCDCYWSWLDPHVHCVFVRPITGQTHDDIRAISNKVKQV